MASLPSTIGLVPIDESIAFTTQGAVAREVLHRLAVARRVDDGDHVVGGDVPLDELPRGGA
jgi:hypothetical protein